jgi:hypothetical protein
MILTKNSFLKPLDVKEKTYQWIHTNFESPLLVHGDIKIYFKGINKELLEKVFFALLKVGTLDVNAKQLQNILIQNPTFTINQRDTNFGELIDELMLKIAEIQEVSNIFEIGIKNIALTSDEDSII